MAGHVYLNKAAIFLVLCWGPWHKDHLLLWWAVICHKESMLTWKWQHSQKHPQKAALPFFFTIFILWPHQSDAFQRGFGSISRFRFGFQVGKIPGFAKLRVYLTSTAHYWGLVKNLVLQTRTQVIFSNSFLLYYWRIIFVNFKGVFIVIFIFTNKDWYDDSSLYVCWRQTCRANVTVASSATLRGASLTTYLLNISVI